MYVSEVDITLEKDFAAAFKKFEKANKIINKSIIQQGDDVPPFEMSGLLINYDTVRSPYLKPMQFVLDRKINASYDLNLFYSRAPLPTKVHLEVLEEIEKVL